jgi:hypothetical protein
MLEADPGLPSSGITEMKWFRLYHETTTAPKLRRVAYQAGTTMAHALAVWISMLSHASANEGDKRGTLAGWDDRDCAINLGIGEAVVFAIRREMEGRTLDANKVIAWEQRQYESDDSALRKRAWRDKKRQKNQALNSGVTGQSRDRPSRVPTKSRGEENTEETSVSSVVCASRSSDARGMRLPENWQPSEADRRVAQEHGLDPDAVAQEFCNYWLNVPGAKGRKAGLRGWSLTFQNRCKEVGSRHQRRPIPAKASKTDWMAPYFGIEPQEPATPYDINGRAA